MVTQNAQWKKNRNFYCMLLLDQLFNRKLAKPFVKMPPDEALPMLSPTEVVRLSQFKCLESFALREVQEVQCQA